jgi:hypothetical protein
MARTTGPLFSLDASGSVAKTIVFSKWKGRSYVRRHAIPSNPNTPLQQGMRSVLKYITQHYVDLSDAQILQWKNAGAVDNITPLNAQVRDAGQRARNNLGWRQELLATPLGTIHPPTSPTLTFSHGSFTAAWTRPVADQGDYTTAIYVDTVDPTTGDISTLKTIVDVVDLTAVVLGLDPTLDQYMRVAETSAAGEIGTLSAAAHYVP